MADLENWGFSKTFALEFSQTRSEIETRLQAIKAQLKPSESDAQDLSLSLSKLSKTLTDATGQLPSYDQRQYEASLKVLEQSIQALRASAAAKPKFSFKKKPAAESTSTPAIPVPTTTVQHTTETEVTTHYTISSQTNQYLNRKSLADNVDQRDLTLSNLEGCIVDLRPGADSDASSGISALHARNLVRCVILIPAISGSALLHDLKDCIILLSCHQFRMHASTSIKILLSIQSNPIIEDCRSIYFSKLPSALLPAPSVETINADNDPPTWCVQDFSHIRATPSPNFSLAENAARDVLASSVLDVLRQAEEGDLVALKPTLDSLLTT